MEGEEVHVVILGGGIIGLSTSYYLLTHPHLPRGSTVTIIERTGIAHGASGRAMGMIGREWQPRHTLPLSRLSWKCYEQLNESLGGEKWDWKVTPAMGVEVKSGAPFSKYRSLPTANPHEEEDKREGRFRGETYSMTDDGAVAHVNPAKFCPVLYEKCLELGLKVIIANPTSLDKKSRIVTISTPATTNQPSQTSEIRYTYLQISAGPWSTPLCRRLGLPVPAISNLPGHSIHIRPSETWGEEMVGKSVFAGVEADTTAEEATAEEAADEIAFKGGEAEDEEDEGGEGVTGSIELIYRPDGTVYVAGENGAPRIAQGDEPNGLPDDPGDVAGLVSPRLVRKLLRSAAILSDQLDVRKGAKLVISQLCYRPTSPDGTPLLGWLDEQHKILLAAGHGPWGITLGPGSGKMMADLILNQDPGFSISAFRPSRFRMR